MVITGLDKGLVSIIIPVYNRPDLLADAVRSVLAQTYRPIEIIIVDDGSTDSGATASRAREFTVRLRDIVSYIHQPNSGPGVARETGRIRARGEFIGYLDSDDLFLPHKVALQVQALREHDERDIVYGYIEQCGLDDGPNPNNIPWGRSAESVELLFPDILRGRHWCTSCPLYRRTLTDKIGPWSTSRFEEDFEYDVRAAVAGARAFHIPEFLVRFRHHPGRVSLDFQSAHPYRYQTLSRLSICRHITDSGIALDDPAVQHFAQGLFLSARQLGARGILPEAEQTFIAARKILRNRKGGDPKSLMYGWLANIVGFQGAGALAQLFDAARERFRKKHV